MRYAHNGCRRDLAVIKAVQKETNLRASTFDCHYTSQKALVTFEIIEENSRCVYIYFCWIALHFCSWSPNLFAELQARRKRILIHLSWQGSWELRYVLSIRARYRNFTKHRGMRKTETGNFQVLWYDKHKINYFNSYNVVGGRLLQKKKKKKKKKKAWSEYYIVYIDIYVHTSKMLLRDNKYITSVTLKLAGGCVVYTKSLHLIWGDDWKMWLWIYSHGEWLSLAPISNYIVLTSRCSLSIHDIVLVITATMSWASLTVITYLVVADYVNWLL